MKAINKKRYIYVGILAIFLVAVLLWAVVFRTPGERLSNSQIADLRVEYPICGTELPPTVEVSPPTLEEVIERFDTFVYEEVTGDYTTFSKYISTGFPEMDEKREAVGLGNEYEFYEYPVTVIEDTSGIYEAGDQITIFDNAMFMEANPTFYSGMRVVVPVMVDDDVSTRANFYVYGTYYVTGDGYVLSAFDEEAAQTRAMTGVKVEALLEQLKKD